jgi:hypothetical protein
VNVADDRDPSRAALLNDFRKTIAALVQRQEAPVHVERVWAAWDAKLRAAAEFTPGYPLPSDVFDAFDELAGASKQATVDTLCEWIDVLGRNALELADVQAVVEVMQSISAPLTTRANLPQKPAELISTWLRWDGSAQAAGAVRLADAA